MNIGHSVVDSYTGLLWCGAGLHLLDERNTSKNGKCLACMRRRKRSSRRG